MVGAIEALVHASNTLGSSLANGMDLRGLEHLQRSRDLALRRATAVAIKPAARPATAIHQTRSIEIPQKDGRGALAAAGRKAKANPSVIAPPPPSIAPDRTVTVYVSGIRARSVKTTERRESVSQTSAWAEFGWTESLPPTEARSIEVENVRRTREYCESQAAEVTVGGMPPGDAGEDAALLARAVDRLPHECVGVIGGRLLRFPDRHND